MRFADIGIPFPLFEGPVDEASEYVGAGQCVSCQRVMPHCFELGIGAGIIKSCPRCASVNGLDADDAEDVPCRSCGFTIEFPAVGDDRILMCYDCLRIGEGALTKDSPLGMISWDQAFEGVTHGVPGLRDTEFELVRKEDSEWVGARVPAEFLFELLRTPTYSTIQGDQWQFCCRRPMTYIGRWSQPEFIAAAPNGDGRALFDEIVQNVVDGLWEDRLHDITGIYVFRCAACGRRTAHWDIA